MKEVGKTKDAGYQFGIQRTFPFPLQEAWKFMFYGSGLHIWLGQFDGPLNEQQSYKTTEGDQFHVRVFRYLSHIRMSWKKKHWQTDTVLQVRVIPKGATKCVISFHQEQLQGPEQRDEVKQYWGEIIDILRVTINKVRNNYDYH